MKKTYHCINKPDEWEIRVTPAAQAVSLPKGAKEHRTRDRERAVEWLARRIHDEEDTCCPELEAEQVVIAAESELARRLWDEASSEQRAAWCEQADVDPPRSSRGIEDVPLLEIEILGVWD